MRTAATGASQWASSRAGTSSRSINVAGSVGPSSAQPRTGRVRRAARRSPRTRGSTTSRPSAHTRLSASRSWTDACISARRFAEPGVTERLGSSSTWARERLRNPRWGVRALVHPLHEPAQARQVVEQHVLLQDRRHVERVCRYKVGHRHFVADEELPAVHVLLQDRRHVEEVLPGERYLRREPLLGWVERSVSRHSPERLFQLGRGEEEPSVDLRPCSKPAGEQAFLRVLLRQVEDDRDRLRENEVAIDEDRQLSGRVHGEKLRPPMLALGGVYVDELVLHTQLAQRPEDADRTGRREPIMAWLSPSARSVDQEAAHRSRGGSSRVWFR